MITTVKTSSVVQGMPKYRSMLAGNSAYAPPSYESIATVTATSNTSSLTFSSIPSTFKHLQIRGIVRASSGTEQYVQLQFNNVTSTSSYTFHNLYTNGAGSFAGASGTGAENGAKVAWAASQSAGTDTFGGSIIDILDYADTSKYKTVRSFSGVDDGGTTTGFVFLSSSLFLNTDAISSIKISIIYAPGTLLAAGTTFALYGIKGA